MQNTVKPNNQKVVAPATDIYSEDNLFTASLNEDTPEKEFEPWFKVKIQGVVNSYKIHEDKSLQLKFQHIIETTIAGTTYKDIEDRSIRVRKEKGSFSDKDAKALLGKSVEIIDVIESPVYKKNPDGNYNFDKVERYLYSANNVKLINKNIRDGFELFKIVEFTVIEVIPAIKYDQRKRAQVIDKEKSVLLYEVINGTLITLHKITVQGLTLNQAKELKGKEIVVLDLAQVGKNYICSKIKLKG